MTHSVDCCCVAAVWRSAALRRRRAVHAAFVSRRLQLSDQFFCEGADFGDFNHDGVMDIVSGPYWYAGPKFTERHEYYTAEAVRHRRLLGELLRVHARRQPRRLDRHRHHRLSRARRRGGSTIRRAKPGHWERHVDAAVVDNESPTFTDVTGDGEPELVCNTAANWATPRFRRTIRRKPWKFHADLAERRLPAVHARHGRRRRERRRPHGHAGERRLVGAAGAPMRRPSSGRFTR